jgi:hypothetical protein
MTAFLLDLLHMKRPSKYPAGFRLLIVGLAGLMVALPVYFWSEKMNAVPLDIPISLYTGHVQTQEFTTPVAIPYNVDIAFDTSTIPLTELDCLIGTNLEKVEPCTGQPAILNVQWTLESDSKSVATGSSIETVGAVYSYHKTARLLGNFHSESGKQYKIDLDVLQNGARLNGASPKLEVVPLLAPYEGRFLLAALELLLSIAAVAVGLVMVLVSIRREKRLGNVTNG